eukprot:2114330-Amphidinium_carterae.1
MLLLRCGRSSFDGLVTQDRITSTTAMLSNDVASALQGSIVTDRSCWRFGRICGTNASFERSVESYSSQDLCVCKPQALNCTPLIGSSSGWT